MAFLHDVAEDTTKYLGTKSLDDSTMTQVKAVAKAIKLFIL